MAFWNSDIDESNGGIHYSWEDGDGSIVTGLTNEQIRSAYGRVLYICDVISFLTSSRRFQFQNMGEPTTITPQFTNFTSQVISRMSEMPFHCVEDCANATYKVAATYAGQLFDAFYSYGVALNKSLGVNPMTTNLKNGSLILSKIAMTFTGVAGDPVTLDAGGSRVVRVFLLAMNTSLLPYLAADLLVNGTTVVGS